MTLRTKISAGFICCAIALIIASVFTFRNNRKFVASNNWVEHTHEVLRELNLILTASSDAESAVRGFVITGKEEFLTPYSDATARSYEHLKAVLALTVDNSGQQKNLREIERRLKLRVENLDQCIGYRRSSFEEARLFVYSARGKRIQEDLQEMINASSQVELKLLSERKNTSNSDAAEFNVVFGLLFLMIIIVLIIIYGIIVYNLRMLKKAEKETNDKNWLLQGSAGLNEKLNGAANIAELADSIINYLCNYLNAQVGTVYLVNHHDNSLELNGKYALSQGKTYKVKLEYGEGLAGQAARDRKQILITTNNDQQMPVTSSVLNSTSNHLIITPFLFEGKTLGITEVGSLRQFSEIEKEFISASMNTVGIYVNSAAAAKHIQDLLHETQIQAEELQAQQEELRQVNEELEEQTQSLRQQQEELQMTNEELEQQAQSLELKNTEVEGARHDIEQKTKQLEISSKYKSEFLANMSHELRTPLNSLLILSKDLSENKKGNLDTIQVECAEIIYKSGHDLLILINEVLDLSKIEAGKMSVNPETINLREFVDDLQRNFNHMASEKNLKLTATIASGLPASVISDSQRLNQVLKNLLSNAFKFTEKGEVAISVKPSGNKQIEISVSDTGIGIPEDKQMAVFEAFQQADGGTSRKYGGTGLGLSISRELARLLEGELRLESKENVGSVFSLIIPTELHASPDSLPEVRPSRPVSYSTADDKKFVNFPSIPDDREFIVAGDTVLLIVEDDLNFARVLLNHSRQKGFKCVAAATGEDGLLLAARFTPDAIILDMDLPGINGDAVLERLKSDKSLRHIPVHIISANTRTMKPLINGAVSYLMKPVEKEELEAALERIENFAARKIKNLLIIEDSENSRKAMKLLVCNDDVNCLEASNGREALEIYSSNEVDCIILDLGLPDVNGFELIHQMEQKSNQSMPPVIIYTGRELTREENEELEKFAQSIIIKGVKSEERLLDETALFLHRTMNGKAKSSAEKVYDKEALFAGKKILLTDDDMRNVFALKLILTEKGMEVIKAENGRVALELLQKNKDIDLVLMDIMMPEMDGFEAMKAIRLIPEFRKLPVIALTAKAMKDDKQKCIDAGANDYVTKPIDVERLLSLMRVWLSK